MKSLASIVLAICLFPALMVPPAAQDKKPSDPGQATARARGHKTPPPAVLARRHAQAFARHGHRVKALPHATAATFDCVALGWMIPVQDQGQCGSCWDVSACVMLSSVHVKAGLAKNDGSFVLSPQYVLDGCGGRNGGCDGDDAPTVLDMARGKGLPTEKDYGPYKAAAGVCRLGDYKLYVVADWGYCTPSQQQGIADVQNVKDCLVRYGPISSAVAADGSWDTVPPSGVLPFNRLTPNDVDHDVVIVGWDDAKTVPGANAPGAWKVQNQWGTGWGVQGFVWLGYGSHQIGTEAAWATVATLPPVPPDPIPPGPGKLTVTSITVTFSDGSTQTVGGAGPAVTITPQTTLGDLMKLMQQQPKAAPKK